jgi:type IV secretion system coupling TraD/TrwB family protein
MTAHLSLGIETDLVKRLKKTDLVEVRRIARPDRMPVWKGIPLDMSHAEQPFVYEVKAMLPQQEVCLEDKGLNQLYVCFGAPGTGKSFLMLRLLKQMLLEDWDPPWGGLLLDPKQTLIADIEKFISQTEKEGGKSPKDRFHIIAPDSKETRTNLLCGRMGESGGGLGPRDLGVALALAAQSAGISAREPFWLNEMKRLFGAGLSLLGILGKPQTLNQLAELLLGRETGAGKPKTTLDTQLYTANSELAKKVEARTIDGDEQRKWKRTISELSAFADGQGENASTTRSFISEVLSPFLDPELDYVSYVPEDPKEAQISIADRIIGQGKWVMLKVPKSSLSVARMLSALAKILFQRAALDRKRCYPEGPASKRRIFLFVDEYAELASDLPGEGFGDSIFFSQARQFDVLSFIATQGVPMLENSAVREAWKTILSNSAGKIFYRVADPDTAELASKLLGEGNLKVIDKGLVQSPEGGSVQRGEKLERRTIHTSDLFSTGLKQYQFAFIGTTDGGKTPVGLRFVGGLLDATSRAAA